MSTATLPHQTSPRRDIASRGPTLGHVLAGALLVVIGLLWLIEAAGWAELPWDAAPAVALIVVGAALVALSRTGRRGGLIALGIALVFVQTAVIALDVPLRGGIGERVEQPAALSAIHSPYRLAIGRQTVDLRQLDLPAGVTSVEASVAVGHLVVRVPYGVTVVIDGHVGAGQIRVPGRERSGVDVDATITPDTGPATGRELRLKLSVGLGQIEVQQ